MKLSTKLSLCMGSLTFIIVGLGLLALYSSNAINGVSTYIITQRVPPMSAMLRLNALFNSHRTAELHLVMADTAQKRQTAMKELRDIEASVKHEADTTQQYMFRPEAKALMQEFMTARATYIGFTRKLEEYMDNGQREAAVTLLDGESTQALETMSEKIGRLIAIVNETMDEANNDADTQYGTTVAVVVGVLLGAVALAVVLTWFIVRVTLRQLGKDPGELARIAERVTGGDYNIDDGSARIGVYGNIVSMVEALKEHIENARRESENARAESARAQEAMRQADAAGKDAQAKAEGMLRAAERLEQVAAVVSSASTELAAQIEQSDRGAAESAARLSETATAMNEMNSTVLEVAKNAGSAADVSLSTKVEAEDGARIVEKSVSSILAVQEQTTALKEDMARLDENAKAISQIMGVISDIADQTNLLALNAAIEAARAGEAGRGFAVVADEVRNLAEKTMASTTDVGNAIQAIQESVSKSMSGMDQAARLVDEATDFANRSGGALKSIVSKVEDTVDQVRAIAAASEEQSAASEEINQTLAQVNGVVEQTAQAMAEAARAVSDLASQTQELSGLIGDMKNA